MKERLKIFLRNKFFFLLLVFLSFCWPVSAGQVKYHTVSSGDTLSEISQRYKVRLKDLRRWNNLRSNRIFVGQKLRVFKKETKSFSRKFHRVVVGDTLSEISQRYKVRLKDLRRWNNLRSNRIFVGQKLRVFKKETKSFSRKFHRVVVGDTLSEISQRYKVRLKDLRRWNNLRSNRIFIAVSYTHLTLPTI